MVIVHGLWMTGVESMLLQRHVRAQTDWTTQTFRYASVRDSIADSAARLGEYIERLPPGPVHIVAHSLGGLVTHRLVHGPGIARPGRVVLLCSPVQGSRAADSLARLRVGRAMLGRAVAATLLGRQQRAWRSDREVGVVAGTRSVGLGRVISRLPLPHDGTVALEETRLPGARDSIALPVSHSSALFSAEVAAQTIFFLNHGRFRTSGSG